MNLNKRASRSIALAVVGVVMVTPILNSVSAMEPIKETQNIEVKGGYKPMSLIQEDNQGETIKEYDQETRLGGGPSPSAAWTYKRSYSKSFSASTIRKMSGYYQSAIKSDKYKAGKFAYDCSLAVLGVSGVGGTITSTYLGLFGSTYHSEIQRSANVLASAASKNKGVTLKVKEYIRPASGQKMILFY